MKIKKLFGSLNGFERTLWGLSVTLIVVSALFAGVEPVSALASLIGVTSLIFIAKGMVIGQVLTVVFSVFYGIVSLWFRYYGEMITYLCMTAPMAVLAIFTWLKHLAENGSGEVAAARLTRKRVILMIVFTLVTTSAFWFILGWLGTANLTVSTISVATSFIASYLTWCRSPYYALGYAANDIVLIILWTLAAVKDISCLAMIACFAAFLANDIYGFVCWKRRIGLQENALREAHE